SPDGKYLLAGRQGNKDRSRPIAIWEIEQGKPLSQLRHIRDLGPQQGNCHHILFSPDGTHVGVLTGPGPVNVHSRFYPLPKSMLFVLYEMATGKECFRRDVPAPSFESRRLTMALSPGGSHLAVGCKDSACHVYPMN